MIILNTYYNINFKIQMPHFNKNLVEIKPLLGQYAHVCKHTWKCVYVCECMDVHATCMCMHVLVCMYE